MTDRQFTHRSYGLSVIVCVCGQRFTAWGDDDEQARADVEYDAHKKDCAIFKATKCTHDDIKRRSSLP